MLQAYEAIYRVMLEVFLPTISCNPSLAPLVDKFSDGVVSAFRQRNIPCGITETIVDMSECTEQLRDEFTSFVHQAASTDDTWLFWSWFIFDDALSYIAAFTGI